MLCFYWRLKWVGDYVHSFAVPHQGAYQYHAGSCDLAIREAINLVITMGDIVTLRMAT